MTSRDVGDISTDPGGKSGAEWTADVRASIKELWALNGGVLLSVSGTNALSASIAIGTGFTAYTDGLRIAFIAANTNTGAMTINVNSLGAKDLTNPDGDVNVAGSVVAGRFTEAVFSAEDDAFRLVTSGGTTNVTVVGGLFLQRSAPGRLAAAAGPTTAETTIGTRSFQCEYADSRVVIEGTAVRVTGAGSADPEGVVIKLFVDDVEEESFTDSCQPSQHVALPFYFSYLPGDLNNHVYSVKVSSVISATYPKGSNMIWCSEISPNT